LELLRISPKDVKDFSRNVRDLSRDAVDFTLEMSRISPEDVKDFS